MKETEALEKADKPRLHVALRIFLYLVAVIFGMGVFQFIGMRLAGIGIDEIAKGRELNAAVKMLMELISLIPLFLVLSVLLECPSWKN